MKNKEVLVSVITPLYNGEQFIESTIESVVNQTYDNWEMIIVDDVSTDNSVEIVEEIAKNDTRIKLYKSEVNGGAAVARNKALQHAKGRMIAFLDSDDIWLPSKLEIQVKFMLENNYPISFTSYEVMNEKLESTGTTIKSVESIDYYGYLKNTIIGMSTSIIDKKIVGDFEFFNIRTRQDTYLWLTLLKRGFKAYGIGNILAYYRVHSNSISSNKVKAAKRVWYMYYKMEKLGFFRSSYYFGHYAFNAVKKRFMK